MGQREFFCIYADRPAVLGKAKQEVDVYHPVGIHTVDGFVVTAHQSFYLLCPLQYFQGGLGCMQPGCGIEKGMVRGEPPRLRCMKSGQGSHLPHPLFQQADRCAQVRLFVSEVCPETQIICKGRRIPHLSVMSIASPYVPKR